MDNALYSQHLEDGKRDNVQDASGRGARQGDVYEGGGAGLSAKMKDEGAGRNGDMYKSGGAGLNAKMEDEGAGRSAKMKDEGAGRNKVVRRIKGGGRRATR